MKGIATAGSQSYMGDTLALTYVLFCKGPNFVFCCQNLRVGHLINFDQNFDAFEYFVLL